MKNSRQPKNSKRSKKSRDPFSVLDVSPNATQQELYNAFEEKVLHTTSEFREEIRAEQLHLEHVQECDERSAHHDPWMQLDVIEDFTEELPERLSRTSSHSWQP